MSSTRRSSIRSHRSPLPPSWRSASKNSTPASVSLIFAQPEQGAPLAPAITILPARANDLSLPSSPMSRPMSITTLPEETVNATDTATPLNDTQVSISAAPLDAAQASMSTTQEVLTTSTTDTDPQSLRHDMTSSVPFPSPDPNKAPSSPSPTRASWFGSLSRSKGKEHLSMMNEDPAQTTRNGTANSHERGLPPTDLVLPPPPPPPPPQEFSTTEPAEIEVLHPQPQSIPSSKPSRRWFSASTSPTRPNVPSSPLHSSHTSTVSSLDEEVPKLPDVTPPRTTSATIVPSGDGTGHVRLSSLNPSTSRFTLSIPLLGRPKIPLDQAVAVVRASDPRGGHAQNDITKSAGPDVTTDAPVEQIASVTTPTSDSSSLKSGSSPPSSYSWWDYLPLTSKSGASEVISRDSNQPNEVVEPPVERPRTPLLLASEERPINTQSTMQGVDAAGSPGSDSTIDGKATLSSRKKPESVRSADLSLTPRSAWYSPWGWYGSSSTTSLPVDLEHSAVKTASEMVKEEALSRGTEPKPGTTPEQMNPIQSSISMNTLAWGSFFSSSALLVKTVTGADSRTGEDGMEVMNLDEEAKPHVTLNAANASLKDSAKDVTDRATGLNKLKNPPTSPPKKSGVKTDGSSPVVNLSGSEIPKGASAKETKGKTYLPSKKSGTSTPSPSPPNLVLPTWSDTFHTPPRSLVPPSSASTLTKAIKFMSGVLFSEDGRGKGKERAKRNDFNHFGKGLPKDWDVISNGSYTDTLRGSRKVVVIGIHGWFPGTVVRTVLGEPTGTSIKFVNMMVQAIEQFQELHKAKFEKITKIPLEGEGIIERRVDKLYQIMLANKEWMSDLHDADAILVATHSQGSIVSTHLLDRLIRDGHIRTTRNADSIGMTDAVSATFDVISGPSVTFLPATKPQRICCLALCGIHLGPLRYLRTNAMLLPYFQYFESSTAAARELFEFQNTESEVSKAYVKALSNVVSHGTKMVYVASLNDQVVPVCSALFTAATHPLILRVLYIDGDAYQSTDFLSNLLVLLLRILNSGLSDSGLLAHLSEAVAGSLNGVGHSTAYEEPATYLMAVKYLFLTNDGLEEHPDLTIESFNATVEQNDYEIPWSLRDLIADERVTHFFSREIAELREAFREWHPKTAILREIKRKLQPIQRLPPVSRPDSKL